MCFGVNFAHDPLFEAFSTASVTQRWINSDLNIPEKSLLYLNDMNLRSFVILLDLWSVSRKVCLLLYNLCGVSWVLNILFNIIDTFNTNSSRSGVTFHLIFYPFSDFSSFQSISWIFELNSILIFRLIDSLSFLGFLRVLLVSLRGLHTGRISLLVI